MKGGSAGLISINVMDATATVAMDTLAKVGDDATIPPVV